MFGGVDAAGDAQDFLRGGDFVGIDEAVAMMGEACTEFSRARAR